MSYVNKYTESATYSGGNLIFTLNDGLTYSVNIPTYSPSSRLTAWNAYNTNGLVVQTSATTWAGRTIVGPAAGITVTNGNGISGNPTLVLANDLSALEGLGSTGFAVRTGTDTWSQRTLIGSDTIDIINGNGVSGNPTLQLSATASVFRKGSGVGSCEAVLFNNSANGGYSFAAGANNVASGFVNFVFGSNNTTFGGNNHQNILGGSLNIIGTSSHTTIINGYSNTIINTVVTSGAAILGGQNNTISGQIIGSVILGGQNNTISNALSDFNGILGGYSNTISNSRYSVILGGQSNVITSYGSQTQYNALLNSNSVTLTNTNNVTVIGGVSTTITESNIVYVGQEIVGGKVATTVLSSALSKTTSTIYSNIISFNAKDGAVYRLRLIGTYQTAATTTGIKVRMSGTAVANVTGYMAGEITSVTGATGLKATISSMTSELITTGVSAINTPHAIDGDIIVRCTTAGTVILQMASEVNGSAAQLNIGTAVIVERVI